MEHLAKAVAQRDRCDWQFRYSLDQAAHFGRLRDAIDKLRTSIAGQRVRVDDDHPDLLKRRACLAEFLVCMNQASGLTEAEDFLRQTIPALREQYGFKHPLTLRAARHLVFLLEEQGMDAEEWRQHLPEIEEEADMGTEPHADEGLLDSEDLDTAELVRDLLEKQHPLANRQVCKVLSSSASGSTPAAAQDASAPCAPTSSIAPIQRCEVVSEADRSQSGYASNSTSSGISGWLKIGLQQKLHELEERKGCRE